MNRTRRILHDIHTIEKDPIEGIHIQYTDNIDNIKALIQGNADTPYEFGFFCFDIKFPPTYPHVSPMVTFINPNPNVRFHPNLYRCGKVCLSLLGTWEGPQWTSCQTLKSVLVSLQSILDNNPMRNEPSFEKLKESNPTNVAFNMIVTHYTLLSASLVQTVTPCCKEFKSIITEEFNKNKTAMIQKINSLSTNNGTVYQSRIYGMKLVFNSQSLLSTLEGIDDFTASNEHTLDTINKKSTSSSDTSNQLNTSSTADTSTH